MDVCMLAYTFYESDNRVRRYAETLARRGDRVEAIVLARPGQIRRERISGVNVIRIQERQRNERGPLAYLVKLIGFFIRSFFEVSWRHFSRRYDLIHVHSVPDFEVFAALIPRLLGAKIILDIHDITPEFYASKFRTKDVSGAFKLLVAFERLSCMFANHVIIANHLWQQKLTRRSVPIEKCTTLINYPDATVFRAPKQRLGRRDKFVICYPGTLNWHQGVDVAINAIALLRNRISSLEFIIIGDGPDRESLEDLIVERGLTDQVKMVGTRPIEGVAEALKGVDLGVVPKRADSFGNEAFSTKIMEFMTMRVPVVASDTSVDRFYFNDEMVRFVPSGDDHALAEAIDILFRSPELRDQLVENAARYVAANSWQEKEHEYLDLVDRLVLN